MSGRIYLFIALLATVVIVVPAAVDPGQPRPTLFPCAPVAASASIDREAKVTISGTLCQPRGKVGTTDTVEILVPGVTYDRRYWETPPLRGSLSYARSANQAGYATLAIDPLGTGESSHPDPATVTLAAHVAVLHQLVQQLGKGNLAGRTYRYVVTVGHSFGSSIALKEASDYGDVEGVIASGFAHGINSDGINAFFNALVNSADDPVLGGQHLPVGYLTTKVGTRAGIFYRTDDAEPRTVRADEAGKSTMTSGDGNDIATVQANPAITQKISRPVLIANGQRDALLCGTMVDCTSADSLQCYESQYFSREAHLQTYILPSAGHSANLHTNSASWFDAANLWVGRLP